jgi:DNA polymerase-3 subunit delta'
MARARVIEGDTETPPEADRLEGWPHPRETGDILGHGEAERRIVDAIASDRMHHAWLLTGELGIGKASFAYRLARYLLSQQAELPSGLSDLSIPAESPAHRQVAGLSHPGLLVIRRAWDRQGKKFRQSIAVDDIRSVRHFLQRTAVTHWRAVIVDSADDLNLNSANALLKSLEEPPPRTVFLLVSSSPGRLLPTIRSRCRTVRFEPLGADDLRAALANACEASGHEMPQGEQLETLAGLSRGSVRRALQLIEGNGLTLFQSIITLLESLPRLNRQALHKLIGLTAGRDTLAHEMAFDLLEEILADVIRACPSGETAATVFPQLRRFPALVTPDNLADWAELWETMREARGETERLNLDKAALTVIVFERIARLSRISAQAAQ